MKTVQEVLSSGAAYLEAREVEGARSSMQSMLAHVLGQNRTWLYLHAEDPLSEETLAPLREMLRARGRGTPLQHLLGSVEFYRREFRSDARALVPRPETEELVELALGLAPRRAGLRVLDMGTGSGVIGITMALELRELRPEVVLADVSPTALSLALENATRLGARARTYVSDLFSAWEPTRPSEPALPGEPPAAADTRIIPPTGFDIILANLPYVPEAEELAPEVRHDPPTALFGGADGLDVVRRFVAQARGHLAPGGVVLLEVGHDQGERTAHMLREAGYTRVELRSDLSGKPRFPLGFAAAE